MKQSGDVKWKGDSTTALIALPEILQCVLMQECMQNSHTGRGVRRTYQEFAGRVHTQAGR